MYRVSNLLIKKGESVDFTILNKSDSVLYFSSFILEALDPTDNNWYEQVYDVLNANCSELIGKEGFVLQKDSLKKIVWNPPKVNPACFNYKVNSGKYRLCFKYRLDYSDKSKSYFKIFRIE